jgi:hypothetical protein
MKIAPHVSPQDVVNVAVSLFRAVTHKRMQQDARQRDLRGKDAAHWVDHATNVYRHDLVRRLSNGGHDDYCI